MKKITIYIFLLIFACKSPYNSGNTIYEDYETNYTNAGILNIRKNASLSSEIINQIPYGSKINTSDTKTKETYQNKLHSWHFVKETNGFVLDYFLQKNETQLPKKKMILKSTYSYNRCNLYGIGTYKTIELHNNVVYFTDEYIDFDLGEKRLFHGKYLIENDSILNSLVEVETQTISYTDGTSIIIKKNIPKENKTISLKLFWKESLKGFITNDQIKYLDTTNYKVDIKNCIFTNLKCKNYDPSKENCSEKYEKSDVCDQIGYFCKR
ncbi:hypothetical protein [Leptospira kanakyensis]|uniref:hypothetical protein n=1 Tax=Leptospira kanakyensis TaxID=2484968 RepID=UPI00223CCF46|nr:hypothetical protein [Leptospira kanakyensis]MCW7471741.1 hypothetical protein [Leptospira kanakyensis]